MKFIHYLVIAIVGALITIMVESLRFAGLNIIGCVLFSFGVVMVGPVTRIAEGQLADEVFE
jgi:hypothetical protein